MRWIFAAATAKQVLLDWETAACEALEMWRGTFAAARGDSAAALLAELPECPDFERLWDAAGVRFRMATPTLRRRDPATGTEYQLYLALRRPVLTDSTVPLCCLAQPISLA